MEAHKNHWLEAVLPRPDPLWMKNIRKAVRESDKKNPKSSPSRMRFGMLVKGIKPHGSSKCPRLGLTLYLVHWSRRTGLNLEEERQVVYWGITDASWTPTNECETLRTLADTLGQAREVYIDYTRRSSLGRPDKNHLRAQALLKIITDTKRDRAFSTDDATNELSVLEPVHNWRSYQAIIGRFLQFSVSRGWLKKLSRSNWMFIVTEIPSHKNPSRELQRHQKRTTGEYT